MNQPTRTFRIGVLAAIENSDKPLTGLEVASLLGAKYKPTIDALDYLRITGKIKRIGRKSVCQWSKVSPTSLESSLFALERAFLGMNRSK